MQEYIKKLVSQTTSEASVSNLFFCRKFILCCSDYMLIFPCCFIVAWRAQFAGMLLNSGPNLVDPRGRLLPRSYDVLGNSFIVLILSYYRIWLALPFGLSVLILSGFPFCRSIHHIYISKGWSRHCSSTYEPLYYQGWKSQLWGGKCLWLFKTCKIQIKYHCILSSIKYHDYYSSNIIIIVQISFLVISIRGCSSFFTIILCKLY